MKLIDLSPFKENWIMGTLLCCFTLLMPFSSMSQMKNFEALKNAHSEKPSDVFIAKDRSVYKTSVAYEFKSSLIFTTQVNIDENGENMLGDAANEPSIAIDPTNPDRMLIAWRQFDDVNNNFRQAGYGYSLDGGDSWVFPGVIDGGVFRSDPVLDTDSEGVFYYNSLTLNENDNYECTVFKSESEDFDWDSGTDAHGGDKQWMAIDKTNGIGEGNNYSFWTAYFSSCEDKSFTRSVDYGEDYEDCEYVDGNPQWGTIIVGNEGEVYISGISEYGQIMVTKSLTAQDEDEDVSWEGVYAVDLDGYPLLQAPVNPVGLAGQIWIDIDRSNGLSRGNLYVMASVERNNNLDPLDVMFTKSSNGGISWTNPIRINDDYTNDEYQWLATLSVAPNGRIDAVWLDTRELASTSYHSALYYSYSIDQGDTWSVNEKVSEVFDPKLGYPNQEKMGDYFHMVSDNENAHLAWCNTMNGEQDVYYSRISPNIVGVDEVASNDAPSFRIFPNPAHDRVKLKYSLQEDSKVALSISDLLGNALKTITLSKTEGAHIQNFDLEDLPKGVYFCKIKTESHEVCKKMILL